MFNYKKKYSFDLRCDFYISNFFGFPQYHYLALAFLHDFVILIEHLGVEEDNTPVGVHCFTFKIDGDDEAYRVAYKDGFQEIPFEAEEGDYASLENAERLVKPGRYREYADSVGDPATERCFSCKDLIRVERIEIPGKAREVDEIGLGDGPSLGNEFLAQ